MIVLPKLSRLHSVERSPIDAIEVPYSGANRSDNKEALMPQYRADFDVESDLVFANAEPLTIRGGEYEITLRNSEADSAGHVRGLIAQIVGECESIERAPRVFRDVLADQLDLLSFSTHSAFSIEQCRRVLDWEPNQKSRRLRPMQKFDSRYPPSPDLQPELLQTVETIARSAPADYVLNALRHFRYGVIESQPEEQFQHFWRALEIIAEGRKEAQRVPIPCPKCGGDLHCEQCHDVPTRRPMARQAILQLLEVRLKEKAIVLFRSLSKVRDQITHGRSVAAIEAQLGAALADVVNGQAAAAWYAIWDSLPQLDGKAHILHRNGDFARSELIAIAEIQFEVPGDADQPTEAQIPAVNIDMTTRFGPLPDRKDGAPAGEAGESSAG
jgi:hypothetical protein